MKPPKDALVEAISCTPPKVMCNDTQSGKSTDDVGASKTAEQLGSHQVQWKKKDDGPRSDMARVGVGGRGEKYNTGMILFKITSIKFFFFKYKNFIFSK